ncbi:helix-turn-helix domain-containing protein [Arenibaculum sp.]|uniref:TetR/AcrR family transcriptional regulator n=1 Tax=Arenibaculum sp. TaxID=2865862 RepID=UPI002E128F60|nr:helix-turn-helix domain-containing protein [Arenibaculum sp.]
MKTVFRAFWRRGYAATSMRDLEAETGVGTASLYNAFGDKRALFRTALEAYMDAHIRSRMRRLERMAPVARIDAFVHEVVSALADDSEPAGCLVINSVMESAAGDRGMRDYVAGCIGEVEEFIRVALEDAAAQGAISPDLPVRDVACGFMTMLLGLHVAAKLRPGLCALESAARPMLSVLRHRTFPAGRAKS